jgi:Ser/Thr protein kinase RdoA (MazF antagonist)
MTPDDILGRAAVAVLARFSAVGDPGGFVPLGNRGGFSGARLWRGRSADGQPLCLRAWPPVASDPARLSLIHAQMRAAGSLPFVPRVRAERSGTTWVASAGRLWDLTDWMPGRADFRSDPSTRRLDAACAALAALHRAWSPARASHAPCPAVLRRLEAVRDWQRLVAGGWRPEFGDADDPVTPWALRAWRHVTAAIDRVPGLLAPWAARAVPVQACLCDVWHDHILFEGDAVSGVVDYGSLKPDHVAVDLARLLGSLVGGDRERFRAGLACYARSNLLAGDEAALAELLDRTGVVLGAANWLRWLYHERRQYEDRAAVARRLANLVERMDGGDP